MAQLRHVNLTVRFDGSVTVAPPSLPPGPSRQNPIFRVVDIPPGIDDDTVVMAYERCIVLPVMHAGIPLPWHRIADAQEGDIIRLKAGRPPVSEDSKAVRINVSLSPAALATIDARVGNYKRSQEIERLIMESVDKPGD